MKAKTALIAFALAGAQLCAAEQKEGIVNFANCVTDSKLGKQEQATFEATRKQFYTLLEDTDKQIKDLNAKLQDKDYLDGLSPEAEQDLKNQVAQKTEELYHYNQQYSQFINQGQYKLIQAIMSGASKAAEKVAVAKGYSKITNKDVYLYYAPSLDITAEIVKEMDKSFDEEAKKQAAATPSSDAPKVAETQQQTEVKKDATDAPKSR